MAIVNIRGDRLYHEHITWDQVSLLDACTNATFRQESIELGLRFEANGYNTGHSTLEWENSEASCKSVYFTKAVYLINLNVP